MSASSSFLSSSLSSSLTKLNSFYAENESDDRHALMALFPVLNTLQVSMSPVLLPDIDATKITTIRIKFGSKDNGNTQTFAISTIASLKESLFNILKEGTTAGTVEATARNALALLRQVAQKKVEAKGAKLESLNVQIFYHLLHVSFGVYDSLIARAKPTTSSSSSQSSSIAGLATLSREDCNTFLRERLENLLSILTLIPQTQERLINQSQARERADQEKTVPYLVLYKMSLGQKVSALNLETYTLTDEDVNVLGYLLLGSSLTNLNFEGSQVTRVAFFNLIKSLSLPGVHQLKQLVLPLNGTVYTSSVMMLQKLILNSPELQLMLPNDFSSSLIASKATPEFIYYCGQSSVSQYTHLQGLTSGEYAMVGAFNKLYQDLNDIPGTEIAKIRELLNQDLTSHNELATKPVEIAAALAVVLTNSLSLMRIEAESADGNILSSSSSDPLLSIQNTSVSLERLCIQLLVNVMSYSQSILPGDSRDTWLSEQLRGVVVQSRTLLQLLKRLEPAKAETLWHVISKSAEVKQLNLNCCDLTAADIKAISFLLPGSCMHTLDIGNYKFDNDEPWAEAMQMLAKFLPYSSLTALYLQGYPLDKTTKTSLLYYIKDEKCKIHEIFCADEKFKQEVKQVVNKRDEEVANKVAELSLSVTTPITDVVEAVLNTASSSLEVRITALETTTLLQPALNQFRINLETLIRQGFFPVQFFGGETITLAGIDYKAPETVKKVHDTLTSISRENHLLDDDLFFILNKMTNDLLEKLISKRKSHQAVATIFYHLLYEHICNYLRGDTYKIESKQLLIEKLNTLISILPFVKSLLQQLEKNLGESHSLYHQVIDFLSGNPSVKAIDLSSIPLTSDDVFVIAHVLSVSKIQILNIGNVTLGHSGLYSPPPATRTISDAALSVLFRVIPSATHLTTLGLYGIRLSGDAKPLLTTAVWHSQVLQNIRTNDAALNEHLQFEITQKLQSRSAIPESSTRALPQSPSVSRTGAERATESESENERLMNGMYSMYGATYLRRPPTVSHVSPSPASVRRDNQKS